MRSGWAANRGSKKLAGALAERPETVAEALNCHGSMRPESLDGTPEGQNLAESLAVTDGGTERAEELLMLRGAIRELEPRERQLLFYRYFRKNRSAASASASA